MIAKLSGGLSLLVDLYCESTEPCPEKTTYWNIYIYIYILYLHREYMREWNCEEKKRIILNYKIK